jgi:tetratricopeptide (TPR) repeat protein
VAEGRPQLVTVAGDAGVGKSRLVRELHDVLAGLDPAPRLRVGRCVPYGRGVTYQPLADVLRAELGLRENDPPDAALARLGDDPALGLTLGLDVAPDVHPLEVRARLEDAWTRLLGRLAAEGPAVVILEDLHWAQEVLLDLVERLHREVPGPLLLVGTARPELLATRPAWGRHPDAATVWLEPLPRADAARLLELAGGGSIPADVRAEVLDRAEGNPFFLEELAQAAPYVTAIPDSVQGVLAGRIDLLPPREKAALQAAAVIGRIFWPGAVVELLDGAAPDFGLLEGRDFVRRRSGSSLEGERELAFKHALTWEVAYGSLTTPERARLHAGFAAWLERTGGGRDEHAALLAQHYADAVVADDLGGPPPEEDERLRERAVHWLVRASDLAVRRYELEDAIAMLHRALELDATGTHALELWRRIGRAHALRHDGDAFLEALMRAIPLAPDRATEAELYADLSVETAMRTGMWRRRPERELVDGWIARALELAEPESATRARALIARCIWAPHGSRDEAREASRIAERLGDPELRSYAWDARGITMWVDGEPDLGRAFEERRFELLGRIHDPDHVADIHYAPITGCVWLGYFKEAHRLADRHDEIVSTLTPHHRIHGLAVQTELEELVGGWDAILGFRDRVETVVLGNRDTPCMRSPRILLVSALAALQRGEPEQAAGLEALAEEFEVSGFGHTIDTPRIRLALVRGDLGTVERLVAEPLPDRGWHRAWLLLSTQSARLDALAALGRRDEIEAWPAPRPGTYLEPFLLRALALVREDGEALAAAAASFERLRLGWHAAETRALLA